MNQQTNFKVKLSGLHCQACQKLTKMMIEKISGVTSVEVDLDKSEAQVTADREISLEELKKALEMTNYQVVNIIN